MFTFHTLTHTCTYTPTGRQPPETLKQVTPNYLRDQTESKKKDVERSYSYKDCKCARGKEGSPSWAFFNCLFKHRHTTCVFTLDTWGVEKETVCGRMFVGSSASEMLSSWKGGLCVIACMAVSETQEAHGFWTSVNTVQECLECDFFFNLTVLISSPGIISYTEYLFLLCILTSEHLQFLYILLSFNSIFDFLIKIFSCFLLAQLHFSFRSTMLSLGRET